MRSVAAEFAGTFALVFVGGGSIMVVELAELPGGAFLVPLVFGLTVALAVRFLGPISGAHINPAVTVTLAASGRLPGVRVRDYLLAQSAGAVAAAFLLRLFLGEAGRVGATVPSVGVMPALFIEGALTLVLVTVVLAVALHPGCARRAPVLLGGTVALEAYLAGPLTGASMNPARSLGPALASGELTGLWLYLVGPVAGGLAALALLHFVLQARARLSGEGAGLALRGQPR
jgi:aquaporin Z